MVGGSRFRACQCLGLDHYPSPPQYLLPPRLGEKQQGRPPGEKQQILSISPTRGGEASRFPFSS